jgi:hypothetical protein
MLRKLSVYIAIFVFLLAFAGQLLAMQDAYIPGIKIIFEVRTAQGELRSFHKPGSLPTYWAQNLPVVKGDKVTIAPIIATGGAEVKELRLRLDNNELSRSITTPLRVEVDTSKLAEGYHAVEVWVSAKAKDTKENTVTTTFLVVPPTDPLLRMLTGDNPTGPPISDQERLSCAIRALDAAIDKDVTTTSQAKVAAPTLFYVSAGPTAKEYFYTFTRDGRVTYTSPTLPLLTQIQLEPAPADTDPAAIPTQGQEPGEFILTVRVGDGAGRFGPPAWITVKIEAPEPPPTATTTPPAKPEEGK